MEVNNGYESPSITLSTAEGDKELSDEILHGIGGSSSDPPCQ